MEIDSKLHHYSQKITPNSLEIILEMYEKLGCKVVYRPESKYRWAMVGQEELGFAIQIVEYDEKPVDDIEIKKRSHIAFLSDNPRALIAKIESWAKSKEIRFREGGWNEKERYFDLPDIFIDFVVEIMHVSVAED